MGRLSTWRPRCRAWAALWLAGPASCSWVYEGSRENVPAEALTPGKGYRFIAVGKNHGILVGPDGKAEVVRQGSFDSSPPLNPKLKTAIADAQLARDAARAPCPTDPDNNACLVWCRAVSSVGAQVTGRVQGETCADNERPTCRCERDSSLSASCLADCSSKPTNIAKGADEVKVTASVKAKATSAPDSPAPSTTPQQQEGSKTKSTSGTNSGSSKGGQVHDVKPWSTPAGGDTSSSRYLLYDTKFGTSFAEQLEVFLAMLDVTRSMNDAVDSKCQGKEKKNSCAPWTLVLPPWCSVVHWYFEPRGVRWRELFEQFSGSVAVVEFESVKKQLKSIDLAVLPAAVGGGGGRFGGLRDIRDCEQASNGRQKVPQVTQKSGKTLMAYSGFCDNDLAVGESKCAFLRAEKNGVDREAVLEMMSSVADGTGSKGGPPKSIILKHLDALDLRPPAAKKKSTTMLAPQSRLDDIANKFIKRTLGDGASYLSAHIRRNEFVQEYPDSTPSAAAAAARINAALKEHNMDQVFVHTDALPEYREELRRLVRAPLYYFAPDDGAPMLDRAGYAEVVCIRILMMSRVFIGTENSAYSRVLRRERKIYGLPKEASEVFCRKLTEKDAEKVCY